MKGWGRWLLGRLLARAVRLLYASLRVERVGREAVDALIARGEGYAYGFWHGRQLVLLGAHEGERCAIMVSLSRDGDLQDAVCREFGYRVVRGSTSRRGRQALVELSDLAGEGWNPALALDGPRGPNEQARPGLVAVARRHRLWVVPLAAASGRRFVVGSWDRTQVPWPFTRVAVVYGAPFRVEEVAGDDGPGATRKGLEELQRRLDAAVAVAEGRFGRAADVSALPAPPLPAPAPAGPARLPSSGRE